MSSIKELKENDLEKVTGGNAQIYDYLKKDFLNKCDENKIKTLSDLDKVYSFTLGQAAAYLAVGYLSENEYNELLNELNYKYTFYIDSYGLE